MSQSKAKTQAEHHINPNCTGARLRAGGAQTEDTGPSSAAKSGEPQAPRDSRQPERSARLSRSVTASCEEDEDQQATEGARARGQLHPERDKSTQQVRKP